MARRSSFKNVVQITSDRRGEWNVRGPDTFRRLNK